MFCAKCTVYLEVINLETIRCKNGHSFCAKCIKQSNETCSICAADEAMEKKSIGNESLSDDLCSYGEQSYAAIPADMFYTKAAEYKVDSSQYSDDDNISVSKYNQYWNADVSRANKTSLAQLLKVNQIDEKEISTSFEYNQKLRSMRKEEDTLIQKCQSIAVSTESTPKLIPSESLVRVADNMQNQHEYLVMTVNTSNIQNPQLIVDLKAKYSSYYMDLSLEQVMGTVRESVAKKPQSMPEDQHLCKLSFMPLTNDMVNDGRDNPKVGKMCLTPQQELFPNPLAESELSTLSNSFRALYRPPDSFQPEITPNPQFHVVNVQGLNVTRDIQSNKSTDVTTMNIPRSPVICPISACQKACFVSEFTKHIALDHIKVPRERICPRQCKNFFLDSKLIHIGVSKCQIMFLLRDTIRNLGHDRFKDLIPILVMTTKISLLELLCNQYRPHNKEVQDCKQNFLMIWLTGLVPPQLPISFSLTVWARSGCVPNCHIVHSGRLYSVRDSQSAQVVQSSGHMLLLSDNQVDLLTNKGRHMLELQVSVH